MSKARQGHTVAERIDARGLTPAKIETGWHVSISTVYRARRGQMLPPLQLAALASALGWTEDECRASIERSGKRARASA